MYTTFMFYNERKQRLSIFADREGDVLHIVVIPCSRSDQFSRKEGRKLYAEVAATNPIDKELQKMNITTADLVIKDKQPGKTFINWCKEHYYKKFDTTITIPFSYIAKKKEMNVYVTKLSSKVVKISKPKLKLIK